MSAHNGRLQRQWLSTKGGLAVVRPRRVSSIRQTTLVSHGRVQDKALVVPSSKILPKKGLGWGQGRITVRATAHVGVHRRWLENRQKPMVF